MHKRKKLFLEIEQLEIECNQIIKKIILLDKTHGWTWVLLIFAVIPIIFMILSNLIFDTLLYAIILENLYAFFTTIVILITTFFYTKHNSSKEYDKLFPKQRRLYHLELLCKN